MTESQHNPFDTLAEQIDLCLSIAPTKVVELFAQTLERRGIRVVLAAVADDWPHPQVELTVNPQDITAKIVAQVVDPVLHRVGVPENMVLMLSVAAGEAAVRAFRKYTGQTAPRRPQGPTTWDPRNRRKHKPQ